MLTYWRVMIDIWSSLIDISMILEVKLEVQIGDELCGSLSLYRCMYKKDTHVLYTNIIYYNIYIYIYHAIHIYI